MSGKYDAGKEAEMAVTNELWNIEKGRLVLLKVSKDEFGKETFQQTIVNNKTFICPDLEVYDHYNSSIISPTIRVEVKSFKDFPKNIPFKFTKDILVISKRQFDEYMALQKEEEIPIYIVFAVGNMFPLYKYYWATLDDMIFKLPNKEDFYTWKDGKKEKCYFFRAEDFGRNLKDI